MPKRGGYRSGVGEKLELSLEPPVNFLGQFVPRAYTEDSNILGLYWGSP